MLNITSMFTLLLFYRLIYSNKSCTRLTLSDTWRLSCDYRAVQADRLADLLSKHYSDLLPFFENRGFQCGPDWLSVMMYNGLGCTFGFQLVDEFFITIGSMDPLGASTSKIILLEKIVASKNLRLRKFYWAFFFLINGTFQFFVSKHFLLTLFWTSASWALF